MRIGRISRTCTFLLPCVLLATVQGCSCSDEGGTPTGAGPDGSIAGDASDRDARPGRRDSGSFDAGPPPRPQVAELWYAVDDQLVHIALDRTDGTVEALTSNRLVGEIPLSQNVITMLQDGSLLFARWGADRRMHFFYIAELPDDDADVSPAALGTMEEGLMLEALYSDCEGRVYGMDTGADDTSATGNRLVRFTGNVLLGEFAFSVVSDLSTADVADIDDMGPGIVDNEITDNPGFAIDTGRVHSFNYETGSGNEVGTGGTYGIHALGGSLFDDGRSRLYVLNNAAELFEMNPTTFALSPVLTRGPTPAGGSAGWSGIAGPLTECETGFILD